MISPLQPASPESEGEARPGILIVDDLPANLELLAGMLAEQGFEVRPVLSGKQAIAAARAEAPNLILLDIRMPEMDGSEVFEQLRAEAALHDVPVIFLTGVTETAEKVRAFALGAVDYVTKPFQAEEIVSRVRTHLKIQILQRQLRGQNADLERMVTKRTRELANAHQRLLEWGRLKDDFLRMLAHEIRTPVHGVVGIGDLLIDLCPPSEELTRFSHHFHASSLRLRNLVEDATTIVDLEKLTLKNREASAFSTLFAEVRAALPEITVSLDSSDALAGIFLPGNRQLLQRALTTTILLATAFSRRRTSAHVKVVNEALVLRLHLAVDALTLSGERLCDFFAIESMARSASAAESLGLAPVVAHKILSAFGGDLRLVKQEGSAGFVEAVLLKEPNHA